MFVFGFGSFSFFVFVFVLQSGNSSRCRSHMINQFDVWDQFVAFGLNFSIKVCDIQIDANCLHSGT